MANDQISNMERATVELLWDYLKRDPEHKDRRRTGWGTKTQSGLTACIARGWLTWLLGEWIKDELNETPVRLSSVIREGVTA